MKALTALIARDLHLALRQGADAAMVVLFFVVAVSLFPFGVGPEAGILARIAPGVLWVMALLAALLSLDRIFLADYEDGALELIVLSPVPLALAVLAKSVAHWLVSGLPLVLAAPVLAVLLQLPGEGFITLVAAMLLGTPILSLVGAVGAALALGARRGGILIALLVLPLYIPALIFGASAVEAAVTGGSARPHLLLLGALLAAAIPLCPWAAAAAVRQAVE
jgi:heme exporter protein B